MRPGASIHYTELNQMLDSSNNDDANHVVANLTNDDGMVIAMAGFCDSLATAPFDRVGGES